MSRVTYFAKLAASGNILDLEFGRRGPAPDQKKGLQQRGKSAAAPANRAIGAACETHQASQPSTPLAANGAAPDYPDEDLNFDYLYVTYYAQLFNHVRRMVGNSEDAADIVHDLFVDLIEKRRLVGVDDKLSYIYRAARNAAFDHFRSAHVKRSSGLDDQEGLEASLADDSLVSAEQRVIGRQEVERVKSAMRKLNAREQKVIDDFYMRGKGWKVIAKDLGISVRTARNVRHSALRIIKEELMRKGAVS